MRSSIDIALKRAEILQLWNQNKLSWAEALRRLVQDGGLDDNTAARLLAGEIRL